MKHCKMMVTFVLTSLLLEFLGSSLRVHWELLDSDLRVPLDLEFLMYSSLVLNVPEIQKMKHCKMVATFVLTSLLVCVVSATVQAQTQ